MTESLAEIIRFGFQFEGLLREWMQWNGQKYDIRMHALLQRESKYLTK